MHYQNFHQKFFGGEDENFIKKRQQELNVYFEAISKNPELSNLPPLIKFIEEKKKKVVANQIIKIQLSQVK